MSFLAVRALVLSFCVLATTSAFGAVQIVSLQPSLSSPQPVGTAITWTAHAKDSNPGPLTYRFEVASAGGVFNLLSDYSLADRFTWAASVVEGAFTIRVTVRDYLANETAQTTASYTLQSRVKGNTAVVSTTTHPLIAYFSAPNCPAGSQMQVTFQLVGSPAQGATNWRPCHPGSQNFYIAGLEPSSTYTMNYQVATGSSVISGPQPLLFQTGAVPSDVRFPSVSILRPPTPQAAANDRVILFGSVDTWIPAATNQAGTPIWYLTGPLGLQITRVVAGGTILGNGFGQGTGTGAYSNQTRQQVVEEIDVLGNVLRRTNTDRISEQLVARGGTPIGRFDHEAARLGNGYTLVLADEQKIFPAGTQGSSTPLDVIGAVVLVLDTNFQLVWFWDAFQHIGTGPGQLDINRAAIRGEKCTADSQTGKAELGCPPGLLLSPAADWLHANTAQVTPDGAIIISLRDQDWVIKVDYNHGQGSGNILWKLGAGGDFTVVGGGSSPWFSGQHDAEFQNSSTLSVFDNGNTRIIQNRGGNSRGIILTLDETKKVATITTSIDLGVFSNSMGVAELLPDGNYSFGACSIGIGSNTTTQSSEWVINPPAETFNIKFDGRSYRTFRLQDFYTAPLPLPFQ